MAKATGGESTFTTQAFSCTGFAAALESATAETIGDVRAAIRSALNKMVARLKTVVSSEIRNTYNVPAAILNDRLKVFSARIADLEAELVVGGRSIPLSYFGMKASVGNTRMSVSIRKTERGPRGRLNSTVKKSFVESKVTVEVIKGRRTTLSKSAFVAVMRSGHIGVMHRGPGAIKSRSGSKGAKHKQALYENTVVSIATMFTNSGVNDAIVAKIDADLDQLFQHELDFYLTRSSR